MFKLIRWNCYANVFLLTLFPVRLIGQITNFSYRKELSVWVSLRTVEFDLPTTYMSWGSEDEVSLGGEVFVANLDKHIYSKTDNKGICKVLDAMITKRENKERKKILFISFPRFESSVRGRFGRISLGSHVWGCYSAINARRVTKSEEPKEVALYCLWNLRSVKQPEKYPIVYYTDLYKEKKFLHEGVLDLDFLRGSSTGSSSQVFLDINLKNPRDLFIHEDLNSFRYWADVFCARLGFDLDRDYDF